MVVQSLFDAVFVYLSYTLLMYPLPVRVPEHEGNMDWSFETAADAQFAKLAKVEGMLDNTPVDA